MISLISALLCRIHSRNRACRSLISEISPRHSGPSNTHALPPSTGLTGQPPSPYSRATMAITIGGIPSAAGPLTLATCVCNVIVGALPSE